MKVLLGIIVIGLLISCSSVATKESIPTSTPVVTQEITYPGAIAVCGDNSVRMFREVTQAEIDWWQSVIDESGCENGKIHILEE